jgi:putative membrane protein
MSFFILSQLNWWGAGPWGNGGGPPFPFFPLIPLFWLAAFGLTVFLVARFARPRGSSGMDRAREILAERFARGEIAGDEYRARLEQLR